ncbi:MAG: hypothetical protein AMXMBFR84_45860 [Candidatus Hydrogenedentota bacterium]
MSRGNGNGSAKRGERQDQYRILLNASIYLERIALERKGPAARTALALFADAYRMIRTKAPIAEIRAVLNRIVQVLGLE